MVFLLIGPKTTIGYRFFGPHGASHQNTKKELLTSVGARYEAIELAPEWLPGLMPAEGAVGGPSCLLGWLHIHTYIHTYMHAYIHTYIHTYMHAYIHTYLLACITYSIQTYMHAYMHTYIHAYIHACIHTCMRTYLHAYRGRSDREE